MLFEATEAHAGKFIVHQLRGQDEEGKAYVLKLKKGDRCSDFQDPKAQKRFMEWYKESGLSKTADMHVIFNVSPSVAGGYVDDPQTISNWAAGHFKNAIGEDEYYYIVNGVRPKEPKSDRDKKEHLINQIGTELKSIPLREVVAVQDMINGLYSAHTDHVVVTKHKHLKNLK